MDEQISILIVEDESIVALDLSHNLRKQGYKIAGVADNAKDALYLFTTEEPDVLLMDINIIGEMDGISLTEKLIRLREVPVIFLTALTDAQTLARVKHIKPAAYLTKPYNMQNVSVAVQLAIGNLADARDADAPAEKDKEETEIGKETILQQGEAIFVKHNYKFVKVPLAEIAYVVAESNYITIVAGSKKYMLRMSLQQLEQKIQYQPFVRIHRSYLVNSSRVDSFSETEVQVGADALPMGRSYRDQFIKHFNFG